MGTSCKLAECPRPRYAKGTGLCRIHDRRLRETGDVGPAKAYRDMTLLEKFEAVAKNREGDCTAWGGSRTGDGYGAFRHHKVQYYAHRVAWEFANGRPVPEGMLIMHSCDNRACVNPEHLALGTVADNNADMRAKRRHTLGERNRSAKMTAEDVAAIRSRHVGGATLTELAAEHGVTLGAIWQIVNRYTWKHVA